MSSETDSAAITAWWAELPPVERARLWEKVAPGTAARKAGLGENRLVSIQRHRGPRDRHSVRVACEVLRRPQCGNAGGGYHRRTGRRCDRLHQRPGDLPKARRRRQDRFPGRDVLNSTESMRERKAKPM